VKKVIETFKVLPCSLFVARTNESGYVVREDFHITSMISFGKSLLQRELE
jgi:hypothetical protein